MSHLLYSTPVSSLDENGEYAADDRWSIGDDSIEDNNKTVRVVEVGVTYASGATHRQWFYSDDFLDTRLPHEIFVPQTLLYIASSDRSLLCMQQ